ncbi:class I SAM-dependent methyltransferase [Bradyrhizobium sp. USDA 4454]
MIRGKNSAINRSDRNAPIIHYDRIGLRDRLVSVLAAAGYANGQIDPKDLAALDQFHSRGLEATVDLANELALDANTAVIDIGSGLGGPSRYLAHRFGCKVLGIDISASFVEAATYLASRTNLSDRVSFQLGNALSLSFPDRFFDVAWTQHVAKNIRDRERFYSEAFRVLQPGGQFAIYDVVAGSAGPLIFPVPWSASEEGSFLLSSDAIRQCLIGWLHNPKLERSKRSQPGVVQKARRRRAAQRPRPQIDTWA